MSLADISIKISDIKASHEYWRITGTALITVVLTYIIDKVLNSEMDLEGMPTWGIFLIIIFFASVIFLVVQTINSIFNNCTDEIFLEIDKIINEKGKMM